MRDLLAAAQVHESAGHPEDAVDACLAAVEAAGEDVRLLAAALRHLGRAHYAAGDGDRAMGAMRRSLAIASAAGVHEEAAEALNGLGIMALERGRLDEARASFVRALEIAPGTALRARLEQNLGIVANIHGDLPQALAHYERSLRAFEDAEDRRGCMLAYNNLGMLSADLRRWDDAAHYFERSMELAELVHDRRHRGICLVNRSEVLVAHGRYDEARRSVVLALQLFGQVGSRRERSHAYRALGVIYRDSGRPALAEARLGAAIDLARQADALLDEAEASRELALLHQALGRNQDALRLLHAAHGQFQRLGARVDLVDVRVKAAQLESTYLAVVRDWGQSIESVDSYTHGHCERVATYAVTVARALGLADDELTTIRLGAYLHDVGKVRVPREILNKPGPLTRAELATLRQHTVWGVELLSSVEFPWDIAPIIRSHHERVDGTGYPDGLRGDAVPLAAQVICVADVYDALTTTRSYRPAMPHDAAIAEMVRTRRWWRPDVYAAFMMTVGEGG